MLSQLHCVREEPRTAKQPCGGRLVSHPPREVLFPAVEDVVARRERHSWMSPLEFFEERFYRISQGYPYIYLYTQ